MFKPTDRQIPLLSPAASLSEGAERRLRRSWADGFQREVLSILLEKEGDFAHLYDDSTGRPNWSVARLLGLHILQQLQDLTDQQAVDALAFDVRFQHALGLTSKEAYISRRSHVQFRTRLAAADPEMTLLRGVFEAVGAAAIESLALSVSSQRIDSTRITSNIRNRGRVDLFGNTIRSFLDFLGGQGTERFAALSRDLLAWYEKAGDGSFAGLDGGHKATSIKQLAEWLLELIELFDDDADLNTSEPYQLMVRLFAEHCEAAASDDDTDIDGKTDDVGAATEAGVDDNPDDVGAATEAGVEGNSDDVGAATEAVAAEDNRDDVGAASEAGAETPSWPSEARLRPQPHATGGWLQSPYDPDASYGHKGSGYHVQVTETCGNVATEILTDYAVTGAHVSDHGQAQRALERLEHSDKSPTTLFADAGYASGTAIIAAAAHGTELVSPVVGAKLPADYIGRDSFSWVEGTGKVLSCPEGHAPTRHGLRSTSNSEGRTLHAYFDGKTCRACPLLGRCAVRGPNNGKRGSFHLELLPILRVRDEQLTRQKAPRWKQRYRIRAGVEATMAELKGPHGMGRLRVRRMVKVSMLVSLKLTACNIKRWLRVRRPEPACPSTGTTPGRQRPTGPIARLFRSLADLLARPHVRFTRAA